MRIDHQTLVFFDASCLVAAAGSPTGGSGFLLSLCQKRLLRAVISQPVLLEAERNVLENLRPSALDTYLRLIALTPMIVTAVPGILERQQYEHAVNLKDAHVVAAAIASGASFLLTLDKRLASQITAAKLPIQALSPGEFIKTVLPQHVDYRSIR